MSLQRKLKKKVFLFIIISNSYFVLLYKKHSQNFVSKKVLTNMIKLNSCLSVQ